MLMPPTRSEGTVGWVRSVDLPIEASPPMVACTFGKRLQLVAVDLERQAGSILALDSEGVPGEPWELPIDYPIGMTACGNRLWLTAGRGDSGRVLLRLHEPSHMATGVAMPEAALAAFRPLPLCLEGRAAVIWEDARGGDARLVLGFATESGALEDASTQLVGTTSGIDMAEWRGSVLVSRVSGPERALEVDWFDVDLLRRRSVLVAQGVTAATVVGAGHRPGVAWLSERGLGLRWFNSAREPGGSEPVLASARPGGGLRSLRAIGSEQGWLALLFQEVRLDDPRSIESSGELEHPMRRVDDWMLVLAPDGSTIAAREQLPSRSLSGATGGWLGTRFVLLRPGRQHAVAVYEAGRDG
jgi:hypothetical protein